MKKTILGLFVLSLLATAVIAQEATPTLISAQTVSVNAYVVLGRGIAANPDDPMDFMIVKIGIGKVRSSTANMTIGVLKLDEELYRLRDVAVADGQATGNIYKDDAEVGSFDVASVMKGDTEIWAGTMTLGTSYNLYIIEGVRPIKASELREKVVEYCNANEDANCADRLTNYCQNNPDDTRCRALYRAWCLRDDNMDDTRCRYEFRNWCSAQII